MWLLRGISRLKAVALFCLSKMLSNRRFLSSVGSRHGFEGGIDALFLIRVCPIILSSRRNSLSLVTSVHDASVFSFIICLLFYNYIFTISIYIYINC